MTTTQNQSIYITTSNFMPKCEKLIKFKINGIQHILIPKKLQEINDVFIDSIFYDTHDEEKKTIKKYNDVINEFKDKMADAESCCWYAVLRPMYNRYGYIDTRLNRKTAWFFINHNKTKNMYKPRYNKCINELKDKIKNKNQLVQKKPTNYFDIIPEEINTIIYKKYFTDNVLKEIFSKGRWEQKGNYMENYIFKRKYESGGIFENGNKANFKLKQSLPKFNSEKYHIKNKTKNSYKRVYDDYFCITLHNTKWKATWDAIPFDKEPKNNIKLLNTITTHYKRMKYEYTSGSPKKK